MVIIAVRIINIFLRIFHLISLLLPKLNIHLQAKDIAKLRNSTVERFGKISQGNEHQQKFKLNIRLFIHYFIMLALKENSFLCVESKLDSEQECSRADWKVALLSINYDIEVKPKEDFLKWENTASILLCKMNFPLYWK